MVLSRYQQRLAGLLAITSLWISTAGATWDGEPSLDDIDFNLEGFIDINSYQFRPSEEIRWYGVENGLRIAAGSLETNLLYLATDLRLKQAITPYLNARLTLSEEEFYEPREFPRPQLELEVKPSTWPLSLSLIGTPAYAKREADLGLAATIGERPWNFFRVAWLNSDHYFNDKNELDDSFYRQEPRQLTLEAAYQWADRYQLRFFWRDEAPLEFVLDDQIAVFAYESQEYRLSFDTRTDSGQHFGIILRGFETDQAFDETAAPRSQELRYASVDGYWFRQVRQRDEWTLGLRYDDFRNQERTPSDPAGSFDFTFSTLQFYTTYHHPYSDTQAWQLGLSLGYASQQREQLDSSIPDEDEDRIEAKLRTAWELFSIDQRSALTLAVSFNLDEVTNDPFDGGSVRLRTEF